MKSSNLALMLTIFCMCSISLAQNSPQDYLDAHNKARAEVGVDPLAWDDSAAAYAENYAKSRVKDCEIVHSQGPYGENLVAISSGELNATEAVKMWVAEKQNYDHKANKCINNKECKHYTQVVWSNSFLVGCARSKCDNGWTFVICNYDPAGNFDGEQPY